MESWKSVHSAEKSWGKIKITLLNYWKHFQQNNNKSERNGMKKLFQILLPLMISSQLFAIAGFGLNLDQSIFNVTTYSDSLIDNTNQKAAKLNLSFKNGYGVGGYFYIDVLPIDIDLEAKALLGNYDLSFIDGLSLIVRYDSLDNGADDDDQTADVDESADTTTLLAGLGYKCAEGITFTPNMTQTTVGGDDPTTAINLTFMFKF